MNKMLPVAWAGFPGVYLEPSLLLSIMKASGRYENWIQTNFINLYASVYETGDLIYRDGYLKLFYESTRPELLNSYFEKQAWGPDASSAIAKRLNDELEAERYVLLDLDEYHIPGTYYAGRVHYWRRFLFYGWDGEQEAFCAASHNRFTQLKEFQIPSRLLERAVFVDGPKESIPNASPAQGMSLRLKRGLLQEIPYQPDRIWRQLIDYRSARYIRQNSRSARERTTDTFGPALYDLIIDRLALGLNNLEKMDYRVFGMLAEQKAGMAERLEFLSSQYPRADLIDLVREYRRMAGEAEQLLRLMLRFGSADDESRRKAWGDIMNAVRRMQQCERSALDRLISRLEQIG